jgi:hypothetical protein
MYGEKRNAYGILVPEPEGKRPLGRLRHKRQDSIKMDWIDLAQDRNQWSVLMNTVMNIRVP